MLEEILGRRRLADKPRNRREGEIGLLKGAAKLQNTKNWRAAPRHKIG
jgi:hypothetical protein